MAKRAIWTGPDEHGRLANSLIALYDQFDVLAPGRDHSSDGSIGDMAHQATNSDHNPVNGVVHAIDISHDPAHGVDTYKIADQMRFPHDPRIKYVISNGRIFGDEDYAKRNGKTAWVWGPYTGTNPHNHHMHVSVDTDVDRTDPWVLSLTAVDPNAPVPLPKLKRGDSGEAVCDLQKRLGFPVSDIDGLFGEATEAAVRAFQTKAGIESDGIVGQYTWSKLGAVGTVNPKRQLGIIATVFGGNADPNYSAYDGTHFINDTELGVALPFHFAGTRPQVRVYKGGKSVVCNIVDVGPIYPSTRGPADPYWETQTRPRADTDNVLSEAGIDLTPAAARAIGLDGKGIVDWEFVTKEIPVATSTVEDRLLSLEVSLNKILAVLAKLVPGTVTDPVVVTPPVIVDPVKPPVVVLPEKDTTGFLPSLLGILGYTMASGQGVVGSMIGPSATPTGQAIGVGLGLAAWAASQGLLSPGIATLFQAVGTFFKPAAKPTA